MTTPDTNGQGVGGEYRLREDEAQLLREEVYRWSEHGTPFEVGIRPAVERIVAARIAADRAERRAEVEAEALERVADEWAERWVKQGRHHGTPGCYSSGYEHHLRARARNLRSQP